MKRMTVWLVILLVMFASAAVSASQDKGRKQNSGQKKDDDAEALKIGAELVTVPFTVIDKKNKYITDVKREDITVLEDGKPQEIFSFTRETDLPLTFAMLIDISGSQEFTLPSEKEAALRFLEKSIRIERDLAAVFTFRRDVELIQNLTPNINQIRQALNGINFSGGSASNAGTPPIGGSDFAGTSLYDAVFLAVDEVLSREAGRRVIIMLTDGRDTTSSYNRQKAIERALRSEVLVYAIGIEGRGQYGGQIFTESVDKKTLQSLCEETGGRYFIPKNEGEFDAAFRQIEDDLRQQYLLSYTPGNDALDGSFRSIIVKTNRKDVKDLRVVHRRGYYAKKGN